MLGLKNVLMFVVIFQLGTVYAQTLEIEKNYTEEMAEEVTDITQDELQEGKFFSEIDPEKLSHLEEEYQNEIGDKPIPAAPLKLKCICGYGQCKTEITITYYGRSEEGAKKACERACEKMGSFRYETDLRKWWVVGTVKEVN
jgi:hypothetical protein